MSISRKERSPRRGPPKDSFKTGGKRGGKPTNQKEKRCNGGGRNGQGKGKTIANENTTTRVKRTSRERGRGQGTVEYNALHGVEADISGGGGVTWKVHELQNGVKEVHDKRTGTHGKKKNQRHWLEAFFPQCFSQLRDKGIKSKRPSRNEESNFMTSKHSQWGAERVKVPGVHLEKIKGGSP